MVNEQWQLLGAASALLNFYIWGGYDAFAAPDNHLSVDAKEPINASVLRENTAKF